MARTTSRPTPTAALTLQPLGRHCPLCGETMWAAYHNYRTVTTLEDVVHLTLQIRRCLNRICPQFRRPSRPEAEGRLAFPRPEFGLDVIASIGIVKLIVDPLFYEISLDFITRKINSLSHNKVKYFDNSAWFFH